MTNTAVMVSKRSILLLYSSGCLKVQKTLTSLKMLIALTHDQGNSLCQSLVRQGWCSIPCFWRSFSAGPREPFSCYSISSPHRGPEESLPCQWTAGELQKTITVKGKVSMHGFRNSNGTLYSILDKIWTDLCRKNFYLASKA